MVLNLTKGHNAGLQLKFPPLELFHIPRILDLGQAGEQADRSEFRMKKDNLVTQQRVRMQAGRADDGLGPTSDIGSRLRALYGAVQDEGVPNQLLDLLEKLDSAEQAQAQGAKPARRDGE